jgi:hypothetical protein
VRVLAEKTREGFETPPFQIAIGIYGRSDQKRNPATNRRAAFV